MKTKEQQRAQLREEYAAFLAHEGKESTPDAACLFAIGKLSGNHEYLGLTERQLIIELAGALPYFYD
jgi:hypothetical protein